MLIRATASIGGAALASVGLGVCAGLSLALLGSRLMSRFVFGTSALDSMLYAGVAALLLALACAAAFIPLRRALRLDPIVVLCADGACGGYEKGRRHHATRG